jgi:hypothetical protein
VTHAGLIELDLIDDALFGRELALRFRLAVLVVREKSALHVFRQLLRLNLVLGLRVAIVSFRRKPLLCPQRALRDRLLV